MYLVASSAQEVHIGQAEIVIRLAAGERILTEISRKYTTEELMDTLDSCGFHPVQHYQPDNGWYSLVLAQAR
jgi:L-histidine N-alpha-methyltransferase